MIKRRIFAALFLLCAFPAQAQNPGTVTNHAIPIGKGAGNTGFGNASPGTTGVPLTSNGASSDPSFHSVSNAGIAAGSANTVKGSIDGATTSDLAIASCSAVYQFTQWVSGSGWQCGIIPVVSSRAAAATLNLSAFSAVTTLGYATAGDGGGATFKNVGAAPFIDSFTNPCTITAGSSYTNGTYWGIQLTGGTGRNIFAAVTVSGGVVITVNYINSPGSAYTVGDVLTASAAVLGGTGSGFSCQVTSVTASRGSFTDTASNHWQIIPDTTGTNSVLQFGAVGDWVGVDGTATDNFNAIQAASWYSSYFLSVSLSSNGSSGHNKLILPAGEFMVCTATHPLIIANQVAFEGVNANASFIRMCDAYSQTSLIELGDPNWLSACFDIWLRHMSISISRNISVQPNNFAVHSNCAQDFSGLAYVKIGAGAWSGIRYEKGFGGASFGFDLDHVEVGQNNSGSMVVLGNTVGSGLNLGTTIIHIQNLNLGGPSSAPLHSGAGISILGGFVGLDGLHCEQMPTCIAINIPAGANGGMVRAHNVNAAAGAVACNEVVALSSTNVPGNTFLGMIPAGGCANVVTDGQSGGTNRTTSIGLDVQFNP